MARLVLVDRGEPRSVIVLDDRATALVRLAAEELRDHLRAASGADVPICTEAEAREMPGDLARVVVGPGRLARLLGVDAAHLEPEAYRIRTVGNALVLVGHDIDTGDGPSRRLAGRVSPATLYAAAHFLDRHLGVRWLWPGEVGTFVPRRDTIAVGPTDIAGQPDLLERRFRVAFGRPDLGGLDGPDDARLADEISRWCFRHHLGTRSPYAFGHSFRSWWAAYHADHPDYFAVPPDGASQPYPAPERVKLCVSNPAVADQILAEWRAAGSPDAWDACPNDGVGFCTCPNCRALDGVGDQDPRDIWAGNARLAGRYADLWNRLIDRMRAENPRAVLCSYAYGAYRDPTPGLKLRPGIVLQVVPGYHSLDSWLRWGRAGAGLSLRPNWWHMGAIAPHLPLHAVGEYLRFARDRGMVGVEFDSLFGHFGTQGACYYLVARMLARPDLTTDAVIAEYCSAFGRAAPAVRDYLAYWEDFTDRAAYTIPAGGTLSQDDAGLYERACREHGLPDHPLAGGWRVLPHLYTDDVLAPARALLDRADALAAPDDPAVRGRIAVLRDGLAHLAMTRDVIDLAYRAELPDGMTREDFDRRVEDLRRCREGLTPRHVIWGEVVSGLMASSAIRPEADGGAIDAPDGT